MFSEALVTIAGEAGEALTVSSPGFPSRRHASLNTSVTVIYDVVPQHHGDVVVFITDDWILADNMCLTVRRHDVQGAAENVPRRKSCNFLLRNFSAVIS